MISVDECLLLGVKQSSTSNDLWHWFLIVRSYRTRSFNPLNVVCGGHIVVTAHCVNHVGVVRESIA